MHKQRLFVLVAAVIGLVGAFFPWQSWTQVGWVPAGSSNAFGVGWMGYAVLASIAASAGIVFKDTDKKAALPPDTRKIVIGLGGAVAILSLLAILSITNTVTGPFAVVYSLGAGPFITFLAGAIILGVPFIIKGDGSFKMPTKDSIKEDIK